MSTQSKKYLINGTLTESVGEAFIRENRALRLGDGFFETIRVMDGRIPFWDSHFARLKASCELLGMERGPIFEQAVFEKAAMELLKESGINEGGRLRITVFRQGGGAYLPQTNRAGYIAEVQPHFPNYFALNDRGLNIGLFREWRKPLTKLSPIKILGNQVSIQAAIWAERNGFDDALILNQHGGICESSAGNLFVVNGDKIKTPGLKEGGVAGVMRMALVNTCIDEGLSLFESPIDESDLLAADEIFLTNSIAGITWVGKFRHKRYFHKTSDHLIEALNKRLRNLVEA